MGSRGLVGGIAIEGEVYPCSIVMITTAKTEKPIRIDQRGLSQIVHLKKRERGREKGDIEEKKSVNDAVN